MRKERQTLIIQPLKVLSLVLLALLLLVPAASAETYTIIDEDLKFGDYTPSYSVGDSNVFLKYSNLITSLKNAYGNSVKPLFSSEVVSFKNTVYSSPGRISGYGITTRSMMYYSDGEFDSSRDVTGFLYNYHKSLSGAYSSISIDSFIYYKGSELTGYTYADYLPLESGLLGCSMYFEYHSYTYGETSQITADIISEYNKGLTFAKSLASYISSQEGCYVFLYPNNHYDSSAVYDVDFNFICYGLSESSSSSASQHVTVTYDKDSDTYDVSLKRNGEPLYLSIKGKAFGWLPIYTYTTVQDESLDLSLSGLPSRFFGFDLSYHAEVYRLGSGLESSNYSYYTYDWTRGDIVDEEGNILNPDIVGEEGEKVDIDPLVKPPFLEDGGYDTPGIEDIDHDGIHNSDDDDMDGDGIPNDKDPEPYNPYNNGILGSLGVTQGIQFPSFESLEQMIRNMLLPDSLKDMFQLMTPEEYKASLRVDESHLLYGYQNGWFSTADGTVGFVLGVVLVLAALIAVIPRTIFEFFSALIVWLSTAFHSFYDWLVIPSEIFKLVINLLPDELLGLALLLFAVDLLFLFFRFVIPGMISGSIALGEVASHQEAVRIAEEERLKAEERIGDGHGWHPHKDRVHHVFVKRPSSSLRNRGHHEESDEIRTGRGWHPHRRH